jgi:cytochrome c oxidase cbb3-type subunit 3
MPTDIEKDEISGQYTTGHEWDGLHELNTPLPKWWLYTFYLCIAVAMAMFVLLPSIPWVHSYWHGTLGYSSRKVAMAEYAKMESLHADASRKIAAMSLADIRKDPALLETALTAGRITFANNCQPCHGAGGQGRPGFPNLADDVWLWGGKLSDIQTTVTHGIRSSDPDARYSAMPTFGDDILTAPQIQQVADFVWVNFYGHAEPGVDTAPGAKIFADNCAACHGGKGQGGRDFGAPPLASHVHLYSESRDTIVAQVTKPRLGVMPNWGAKLDPATLKSVVLYVHSLGGGEE